MKLIDYLNQLSWSQADLARHAGVSTSSVHRALRGEKLSRRVAAAIQESIAEATKRSNDKPTISGLRVVPVKRRRPAAASAPAAIVKADRKANKQPGE
jgi:transcriptional regulator with XRE-family HTH domain